MCMGRNHERRFWQETERYHDLARKYERDIEITHPNVVSGRRWCPVCYQCPYAATAVTYYDYRGERPSSV
jgi:hypothetical protein